MDYVHKSFDVFKIPLLLESNGTSPADIKDICYKKDGEWISNPTEPFDINRLKRPDRSYFDPTTTITWIFRMRRGSERHTAVRITANSAFATK